MVDEDEKTIADGETNLIAFRKNKSADGNDDQEEKTVVDLPKSKSDPALQNENAENSSEEKQLNLEKSTANPSSGFEIEATPLDKIELQGRGVSILSGPASSITPEIGEEKTLVLDKSKIKKPKTSLISRLSTMSPRLKLLLVLVALLLVLDELFEAKPKPHSTIGEYARNPVVVRMPPASVKEKDLKKSGELYIRGIQAFASDNDASFRRAADFFRKSIAYDGENAKAIAMLAASYVNLIDSSNRDDDYFGVILKLMDFARAKGVDLPETVIADVEYFNTINKSDAAFSRIVEYTQSHQQFGSEMFLFLAQTYALRRDYPNALRFIKQIPEAKIFGPRVYYVRGLIAEVMAGPEQASVEYEQAIKKFPEHAKSRLKYLKYRVEAGRATKDDFSHFKYLLTHKDLMNPREVAESFYLYSQFLDSQNETEKGVDYASKAVDLESDNSRFKFNYYYLKAKISGSNETAKRNARMYLFLSEGEKALSNSDTDQALSQFLMARQENSESYEPLMHIGEMFLRKAEYGNARLNFEKAVRLAPKKIEVIARYATSLIEVYEWPEAQAAIDRLRILKANKSLVDRLRGDLSAKQKNYQEAMLYYRRALGYEAVDSTLYLSYAKVLMANRMYKDAPLFLALSLRFDPLNFEVLLNSAKIAADTESVDRAIQVLQEKLEQYPGSRVIILSEMARYQVQKGEYDLAQKTVDEAKGFGPESPYPFRAQAEIYLNREPDNPKMIEKALEAYKSYSDRFDADPSGYLDRYKLFIRQTRFDEALSELDRIYSNYPKYPDLHYYRANAYATMKNFKLAIEEFQKELQNNPKSQTGLMGLGKALLEVNQYEDAFKSFAKAMQLAPALSEPKHWAGWTAFLNKNPEGAVALLRAAQEMDPGNSLIYKRLGIVYKGIGDRINASQNFKKYLEMEPDAPDRAEFQRHL